MNCQELIAEQVAGMGFESRTEWLEEQDCHPVRGPGPGTGEGESGPKESKTEFGATESFTVW